MSVRFLVLSSFLIALLCHLVFVSLFTIVFPVDEAIPQPKFFFLGPILTQKEINYSSTGNQQGPESLPAKDHFEPIATSIQNGIKESSGRSGNPFAIQSISKPLVPRTVETEEKAVFKATFETELITDETEKVVEPPPPLEEINFRPYKPLQFRTP